jgi:uncharacterized protein with NRDE domain
LNYTSSKGIRQDAKSRGELLTTFLINTTNGGEYLKGVAKNGHEYNDFNLLVGDFIEDTMYYYGSKHPESPFELKKGEVSVTTKYYTKMISIMECQMLL